MRKSELFSQPEALDVMRKHQRIRMLLHLYTALERDLQIETGSTVEDVNGRPLPDAFEREFDEFREYVALRKRAEKDPNSIVGRALHALVTLDAFRDLYLYSNNPWWAWEAIGLVRAYRLRFPRWLDEYFLVKARDMCAAKPRSAKEVAKLLGFGSGRHSEATRAENELRHLPIIQALNRAMNARAIQRLASSTPTKVTDDTDVFLAIADQLGVDFELVKKVFYRCCAVGIFYRRRSKRATRSTTTHVLA